MGIARSIYYGAPPANRDAESLSLIEAICAEFEAYGYRRVTAELRHQGHLVNSKRVRRLMREHGLSPKQRRRYVTTTDSDHDEPIFPNLAADMAPDGPNQLWVADITYVAIATGFVYLAAILDAWSRRVVGYVISRSIDARLTIAALDAAVRSRAPPAGCVHHSDRGSQPGLKRSSQQLDGGRLRWRVGGFRIGRALRVPRARTRRQGKSFVTSEVMISQRPAEADDRAVPGHWEGDLILGLRSSAIGTLVERTTRFTMLLHLPPMTGHGDGAREKNGPALAGHGAEAVRDAITRTIITLPEQLRRSLTWDQGSEMAQHARLRIDTGLQVYFCDPHSPWQRGSNENTNGLLRQYFPKGTDLSPYRTDDLAAVAAALNSRPRKTLGWKTPAEALDAVLRSVQAGVAMTS